MPEDVFTQGIPHIHWDEGVAKGHYFRSAFVMSDRYCQSNIQLLYYILSCVKFCKVALTISIHHFFLFIFSTVYFDVYHSFPGLKHCGNDVSQPLTNDVIFLYR